MLDWITRLVADGGYAGIAFLMLAENVFPPIPSELIMPLAGFAAARGDLDLAGVVLAGTVGSLVGAAPWYGLGRVFGARRLRALADRHGRWLTMDAADVDTAQGWFDRHGGWAVLWGRLVPTVRTLISVPAGLARMNVVSFTCFSAVGTLVWNLALAGAGYLLESQYEAVSAWVDPVAKVVAALAILVYVHRVATYRPRSEARTR